MGSKSESILAIDILGPVVVVAHCIADLHRVSFARPSPVIALSRGSSPVATYMHVNCLPIAPESVQNSRHDDQLFLGHEISDTSLILGRVMLLHGVEIEFECRSERKRQQQALKKSQYPVHGGCWCGLRLGELHGVDALAGVEGQLVRKAR